MKNKTIAIVAGGKLLREYLAQIQKADFIIGVDRGAYWLIQHNITPHMAIGDFDSVSEQELITIENKTENVKKYKAEKDQTDLELAVDYAQQLRPQKVTVYGAIGTRVDHVWAGIHLLTKLESHNIRGEIVDNFNIIYIVRREQTLTQSSNFRYVSLFSLTPNTTITVQGFRYNLSKYRLPYGSSLGVSNEVVNSSAHINVHKGLLLVIHSRD